MDKAASCLTVFIQCENNHSSYYLTWYPSNPPSVEASTLKSAKYSFPEILARWVLAMRRQ